MPDYYQVIARPMDLDTMRIKVDQGLYATKDEFRGDVLLIQRNAREYNPCGPQVGMHVFGLWVGGGLSWSWCI